jgi:hypothetical protein
VTREPELTVVEWGSDRAGQFADVDVQRWREYGAWSAAGAGGIAAFGSLLSSWQVLPDEFGLGPDDAEVTFGLGLVSSVWGVGWALGAMVLAACTGLALRAPRPTRATARLVGLSTGAVLLPFLVAAAVNLRRENLILVQIPEQDFGLGPGLPLALTSNLLLGAALWLAPRTGRGARAPGTPASGTSASGTSASGVAGRAGRAEPRVAPPDPLDLTVEAAEPWVSPPGRDDRG